MEKVHYKWLVERYALNVRNFKLGWRKNWEEVGFSVHTQELGKNCLKSDLKCFGEEKWSIRDLNGKASPNEERLNTELYHVKITLMN